MPDSKKSVSAVLLNGKHVKFPIAWDVDQGWVEFEIPIQINATVLTSGQATSFSDDNDFDQIRWERKKEYGDIHLIYSKI